MTRTLPMRALPGRRLPHLRAAIVLPLLMAGWVVPAQAQSTAPETTEARLRRIEGELRALQRKVFPDGAGKIFAPQITPGDPVEAAPVRSNNGAALGDVLARMDAVESQIKALTASSEDTQDRLGKLDARIGTVETNQAAMAAAAAPAAAPTAAPTPELLLPAPVRPAKAAARPAPRAADAPPPGADASAARAAAIAAIERPASDDKGEDAYSYGYRLWEAKFLSEAEATLNDFVQHYPKHKRISFARNLLGRAYLDDNKPGAAAQWFLQNYQADKAGERAADSLLYLGVAMTRLKETKRACVVLDEFRQTYPDEAAGRLKGQFDAVTKTVTCH
jgi:TolA-binding protein